MSFFIAFGCVLIVLAFGSSYFIRRYKETKLDIFRLVCWWGRVASGLLMVAGGMLFVLIMGDFFDKLLKVSLYSGKIGSNIDLFSEIFIGDDFKYFLYNFAIGLFSYLFGRKGLVNYNEMFLSEYRETNRS